MKVSIEDASGTTTHELSRAAAQNLLHALGSVGAAAALETGASGLFARLIAAGIRTGYDLQVVGRPALPDPAADLPPAPPAAEPAGPPDAEAEAWVPPAPAQD